jgi:hypothetical protein
MDMEYGEILGGEMTRIECQMFPVEQKEEEEMARIT